MATFEQLVVGQVLYDVHSYKMGNTNLRTMGCWTVKIVEIDAVGRRVLASWNDNPPHWYYAVDVRSWRVKKPVLVRNSFGQYRLARRGERP